MLEYPAVLFFIGGEFDSSLSFEENANDAKLTIEAFVEPEEVTNAKVE